MLATELALVDTQALEDWLAAAMRNGVRRCREGDLPDAPTNLHGTGSQSISHVEGMVTKRAMGGKYPNYDLSRDFPLTRIGVEAIISRGEKGVDSVSSGLEYLGSRGENAQGLPSDLNSFERHLRARNLASTTIRNYCSTAAQLLRFSGRDSAAEITTDEISEFIIDSAKPSTAQQRFKNCRAFVQWLTDSKRLAQSPMAAMRLPFAPEVAKPLLNDEQLRKLLATCGRRFLGLRDAAILRIFIETGPRRSELAGVNVADVDLQRGLIQLMGKGRRERWLPLSKTTTQALERYLAVRAKHRLRNLPNLWLGEHGSLTDSGLAQIVKRRGTSVGIVNLHPHQLRHTSVHRFLSRGGQEGSAMRIYGWRTRSMLDRYGSALAEQRAIESFRSLNLSV